VEHTARLRLAPQVSHHSLSIRFDGAADDGLIPFQPDHRRWAFREMRLEFLSGDEGKDRREEFVFGSAFAARDSFIFAVTSVTGVTLLSVGQLRNLMRVGLANAMLLDRPLDFMRVELGDVGGFLKRNRTELAGKIKL
jgi:hypothetical protein